jgi:hypothetical protein
MIRWKGGQKADELRDKAASLAVQNISLRELVEAHKRDAEHWRKECIVWIDRTWKAIDEKEKITAMNQPQYAPSNDDIDHIDNEIQKLRDLLATPNITPETIEEANKNLQYLLAQKRMPRHAPLEVWQDAK